jgi:hypothetical protein
LQETVVNDFFEMKMNTYSKEIDRKTFLEIVKDPNFEHWTKHQTERLFQEIIKIYG